jgi:acetate kinase
VGHRIVHGAAHTRPTEVTPEVIADLRRAMPYAPEHRPREIELIGAFRERYPKVSQVACFDTAFHESMPPVGRLLPAGILGGDWRTKRGHSRTDLPRPGVPGS